MDKKGKIIQRRYYGSDGKAIVNIDSITIMVRGSRMAMTGIGRKSRRFVCRVAH